MEEKKENNSNANIKSIGPMGSFRYEGEQKTKNFDDVNNLTNLLDYKIVKIEVWTADHFNPSSVLNGIETTYQNLRTGELVTSGCRVSEMNLIGTTVFEFQEGEYIVNLNIRSGWVMDCLTLYLNSGRKFSIGGTGGDPTFFKLDNQVVVGFFGSSGTSLYNLGVHTITTEEYHENIKNHSLNSGL